MGNSSDLFSQLYEYLVDYFASPQAHQLLLWIKFFSAAVSIVLFITIIILLSRSRATWWVGEGLDSFKKPNLPQQQEKRWQKIQDRLEKTDEANLKLSVIEADNLLDDIFKRMGLVGKDMGERLEQFSKQPSFSTQGVWEAHRLRNIIVHQSGVKISQAEAKKAIEAYEKLLKELEVL